MICPYCGKDKPSNDFTNEHVIPKALGGNLRPTNPFKLRVCRSCNTTCGLYVDGPFIKSWFMHNDRAIAASYCLDVGGSPALPLVYMGPLEPRGKDTLLQKFANKILETFSKRVCEYWIGPTGDHIYHFHKPYPSEPTLVGKPPHIRREKLDPGCVMIKIVATNPEWHPIIMESIKSEFPESQRYYLNVQYQGEGPPYPSIPLRHYCKHRWIESYQPDEMRQAKISIDINCGHRFSLKLALGLACLFLSDDFVESDEANTLREGLWTTDNARRATLGIHGSPFLLFPDERFCAVFNWRYCHLVIIKPSDSMLSITTCLNGKLASSIGVTSNPSHWEGIIPDEGLVWVISPQLRMFTGPMDLPNFLYQKIQPSPGGELSDLNSSFLTAQRYPPFHSRGNPAVND